MFMYKHNALHDTTFYMVPSLNDSITQCTNRNFIAFCGWVRKGDEYRRMHACFRTTSAAARTRKKIRSYANLVCSAIVPRLSVHALDVDVI